MRFRDHAKKFIKIQYDYHTTDMSSVKPEHRYVVEEGGKKYFYLNCCAGNIRFTSPTVAEFNRFRDAYINKFQQLMVMERDLNKYSLPVTEKFFSLYRRIFEDKWSRKASLRYRANLRTRSKMLCHRSTKK